MLLYKNSFARVALADLNMTANVALALLDQDPIIGPAQLAIVGIGADRLQSGIDLNAEVVALKVAQEEKMDTAQDASAARQTCRQTVAHELFRLYLYAELALPNHPQRIEELFAYLLGIRQRKQAQATLTRDRQATTQGVATQGSARCGRANQP